MPLLESWWNMCNAFLGVALAITPIFATIFVGIAYIEQLLSFIPNVGQRQALRASARFALFVAIVLWEQRGRWCVGFVVKREKLCAGLVLLVRVESEGRVGRGKGSVQPRDLPRGSFEMVSALA